MRVADDYHWARGATGVIVSPPDEVARIAAGWDGARRMVRAEAGAIPFVWVEFDEPQFDADGDGPYAAAEVDARFLVHA